VIRRSSHPFAVPWAVQTCLASVPAMTTRKRKPVTRHASASAARGSRCGSSVASTRPPAGSSSPTARRPDAARARQARPPPVERLYTELRSCRRRCAGRPFIEHRTQRRHECDERCAVHVCRPLAASSIRQCAQQPLRGRSGVDLRTVAGRLGHGSGGATTLKVYAAWVARADQQASELLAARLPNPRSPS
jgi:hypothetical protein